jgi:hypothetical protein
VLRALGEARQNQDLRIGRRTGLGFARHLVRITIDRITD